MALFRSGRPAGHSVSWTSSVPQKTWAPRAFRRPLRARLHARVTRSTRNAGRVAGCGLHFVRLDQVTRACGLGRGASPPGTLPARGRASDGWGHQRLPAPPALHRPRWGKVRFQGLRAALPFAPPSACGQGGSSLSPSGRQATARQRLATFLAPTVARPCELSRLHGRDCRLRRTRSTFCHPSPSPVYGDPPLADQTTRACGTECAPSADP